MRPAARWSSCLLQACGFAALGSTCFLAGCSSGPTSQVSPPPPPPQSVCATPAATNPAGGGGIYSQIAIDPAVYGSRDASGLTVFGFSQEGTNLPADPQVRGWEPTEEN